jgi:hypothetical protein
MRKRQAVSHIFNLDRMFYQEFMEGEFEKLIEKLDEDGSRPTALEILQHEAKDGNAMAPYRRGLELVASGTCDILKRDYGFQRLLTLLLAERGTLEAQCSKCGKRPSVPSDLVVAAEVKCCLIQIGVLHADSHRSASTIIAMRA